MRRRPADSAALPLFRLTLPTSPAGRKTRPPRRTNPRWAAAGSERRPAMVGGRRRVVKRPALRPLRPPPAKPAPCSHPPACAGICARKDASWTNVPVPSIPCADAQFCSLLAGHKPVVGIQHLRSADVARKWPGRSPGSLTSISSRNPAGGKPLAAKECRRKPNPESACRKGKRGASARVSHLFALSA